MALSKQDANKFFRALKGGGRQRPKKLRIKLDKIIPGPDQIREERLVQVPCPNCDRTGKRHGLTCVQCHGVKYVLVVAG